MQINRGLLFWGVALVTAGVVALAASQHWFDTSILVNAWKLWPFVLVAIGLAIVLSRTPFAWLGALAAGLVVGIAGGALISGTPFDTCGGQLRSGRTDNYGGVFGGGRAAIELNLTCGALTMWMADGSDWQALTRGEEGVQPSVDEASDSLVIRSDNRSSSFGGIRQSWGVQVGRDVAYDLSATLNSVDSTIDGGGGTFEGLHLTTNAGTATVNLAGARVADMDLQLNASSANITLDDTSDVTGRARANAGSINLCVPDGAGLQIKVNSNFAFSHNLADRGLEQQDDDTWVSSGYSSAAHKIVLEVEGNAASFNLNPEDGCS